MKLLKYFLHIKLADRLPPLPRQYSTEYDPRAITEDEARLMKMSKLRSPQGVKRLQKRYNLNSASELARKLPHKHKPSRGDRLMPLLRRIRGTLRSDPMKRFYKQHRKR